MIIAAHQPNYLPWLGFMDKLRRADQFLILDHVQFERQNFQNRTKVRMDDGWKWLTVPVIQKSRDEIILEKLIANEKDGKFRWGRKQFATLEQVYRGAPYFHFYADALRGVFDAEWEKLLDLNLALLRFCMAALEIQTPLVRTSTMGPLAGQKSELVLNMCKAAGATVYLSGDGASKHYLDIPAFKAAGIEVRFQEFKHPDYPQGHPKAVRGLSVLDLLFNCGPAGKHVLAGEGIDSLPVAPALAMPPFVAPPPTPLPSPTHGPSA
jgi:hypothetical protein